MFSSRAGKNILNIVLRVSPVSNMLWFRDVVSVFVQSDRQYNSLESERTDGRTHTFQYIKIHGLIWSSIDALPRI